MNIRHSNAAHAGFSLVEVMVALIVISVGLLGIAKMQALALASTGTARMRSIAALEAASLAATMHTDRTYWSNLAVKRTVSITTSPVAFTPQDTALVVPTGSCTYTSLAGTPCATPAALAAVDLSSWATALSQTMPPSTTALITCFAGSTTVPVYCTIELDWVENLVAINTGSNTANTAAQNNTALQNVGATQYILSVEP